MYYVLKGSEGLYIVSALFVSRVAVGLKEQQVLLH